MTKKNSINIFLMLWLCFAFAKGRCQSMEDSVMIAHSEKWNVAYKKGTLTLSQPGSDQTFSMNLIKLDSGKIKQKVKDSADIEFSGSGGFDQSKYMTITKSRVYKLESGTDENSTTALFAITDESKLKRQTVLGKIISKKDAEDDERLSSDNTIHGTIKRNNAATGWDFSISNFSGNRMQSSLFPFISLPLDGFLRSEKDSLFFGAPSFKADLVLVAKDGEHVAAVKYSKKPFTIWVRKDIDNSLQDAIGVFFGVMISTK